MKQGYSVYGVCKEQSIKLGWYNYFVKIFFGSWTYYNKQRKHVFGIHIWKSFKKKFELGVWDYWLWLVSWLQEWEQSFLQGSWIWQDYSQKALTCWVAVECCIDQQLVLVLYTRNELFILPLCFLHCVAREGVREVRDSSFSTIFLLY